MTKLMTKLDPRLVATAAERGGLFTTREALAHGSSHRELRSATKAAVCRTVVRGVHSTQPLPGSPRDRLAELTKAMLLICPTAAATGRSALVLRGLPLYGVNFSRAQGVWLNKNGQLSTEHMLVRRPLVAPDLQMLGAWQLTTIAWNLVDVARDAGVEAGVVAMDAALHERLVTRDAVTEIIDRLGGSRRMQRPRRMVDLAEGRCESAGESRTRLILTGDGIELEPQFEIRLPSGATVRSDFRVKGTRVLIEFDGLMKYAGADGREALAREKAREDALRAQGWTIVRIVWADLDHPKQLLARVRAAIAAAEHRKLAG